MAENLYDVAYQLEQAIRGSNEYQELQNVYRELMQDDVARKMFEDFRNMQVKIQEKQMMGEEIPENDMIQASIMISDVQNNKKISKLLEVEERMGMIMTEINQIMIKPLEELYQQEKK